MLGLPELFLGGLVLLFLVGLALKFAWFLAHVVLWPLKLVFGLAGLILTGAVILLLLPFTLAGILVLLGGLAFVAIGLLSLAC